MKKTNVRAFHTIDCDDSTHQCVISTASLKLLLDRTLLYCCTLTNGIPHITPVMYYFEMNRCLISFLTDKNSVKARNIRKNPFISFTVDITYSHLPLQNTGIMILAFGELSNSMEDIDECLERLRRRYSSHLMPELVDKYASKDDLCVKAAIIKVVYWKGPFFQRFECPTRRASLKV